MDGAEHLLHVLHGHLQALQQAGLLKGQCGAQQAGRGPSESVVGGEAGPRAGDAG